MNDLLNGISNYLNLNILSIYEELKQYKAKQKSKFYEYIFEILENYKEDENYVFEQTHYDKCLKNFPIFNFKNKEDQFEQFIKESKVIRDLSNNASLNKSKIKELKEARGKYFDVVNGTCAFSNYKQLCELFKSVAIEYGRIKANIKGLEKERLEAQKLQSWSVLLKRGENHYLVTIPKEQARKAYHNISNLNSTLNENNSIWLIESLTLRALDKLCFGENSSFMYNDKGVFKHKLLDRKYLEKGKLIRKDEFLEKDLSLVEFYQRILKLETAQSQIQIDLFVDGEYTFHPIFDSNIKTLDKFRSELEKACYIKKEIKISEVDFEKIKQEFGAKVYEITTYDLEKQRKKPKEHASIWKDFCRLENGSGFITRLNPEMKISYVEKRADSILDKSGKEVKRNRRKQAELILSTTISQNNDRPKFDMSFKDKELIQKNIVKFNIELNKKIDPNNIWYYGLDRGQEELLTLGLFRFPQKRSEYQTKDENWNKSVEGGEFEVWELKEEYYLKTNEKGRIAYKNLSYFIGDENLFEKKLVSCIDLTCAKLIGDKIVVNGDISTYLRLKLVAACRKITDGIQNGIFISDSIEILNNGILMLKTLNRGEEKKCDLYFYDSRFSQIVTLDQIKDTLQDHYNKIKLGNSEEDNYSIEKVNHLRDAICANAIGIISKLYKGCKGLICFENLDIAKKNNEFGKFYGNLGSRVELMLLNKFKTLGLVPPSYKMAMSMQSNKEVDQFGIIKYVDTTSSSKTCPNCGAKNNEYNFKKPEEKNLKKKNHNLVDQKWVQHRFGCVGGNTGNCGFDTGTTKNGYNIIPNLKDLNGLTNSDSVAAYNIAKRGLEMIQKTQLCPK